MIAISIIIPAYNVERYVDSCMESVMNQTLQDFEVIIINDGSTDNTLTLFEKYEEKISNLRIINQENTGSAGKPRNIGIEKAVGKYIFCLDPDDELFPNTLELMYKEAERENAELVVGNMMYFNSTSNWFNKKMCEELYRDNINTDIEHKPELFMNLGPCNKLYLRRLITDNEIKFSEDIKVGEDQKFVIGAYIYAKKIRVLKENVYKYRRREEDDKSATQEITLKALRDCVKAQIRNDNLIKGCKKEKLQLECHKKRVKYDFLRYIDTLLDESFDKELIKEIEKYAPILAEPDEYDNLNIVDRLKIKYIKLEQYNNLLKIINYQKKNNKYKYIVKNKELYLNEDGIDLDIRGCIKISDEEIKVCVGIENNKYSNGILDLEGWIYIERLNLPYNSNINKVLVLEHESGEENITYQLKNVIRKDITKSKGMNFYTYDNSGFKGKIDILSLLKGSNRFGEWKIKIVLCIDGFSYGYCFKNIKRELNVRAYDELSIKKPVYFLERNGLSEKYLIQFKGKEKFIDKTECIVDIANNPIYQRIEEVRYESQYIYFKGWIYIEGLELNDIHKVKKTLVLVDNITAKEIPYKCENLISQWGQTQVEYNIWGKNYEYAGWEVKVPYDVLEEGSYQLYIDYQAQETVRRCKLQYMSWKLYNDRIFIEQIRYHKGNSLQLIYRGNNFQMEDTSFYMVIKPTVYRNNNELVACCTNMDFTEDEIFLQGYAFIEGQEQVYKNSNKKSLCLVAQDKKIYKELINTYSKFWDGTRHEDLNPHAFRYSYSTWQIGLDKKEFESFVLDEYKLYIKMEQDKLEGEVELQVTDEFRETYKNYLEQTYKINNKIYLTPKLNDNILNLNLVDTPKTISFIKEINYYNQYMQFKGIIIAPEDIECHEGEVQFKSYRIKLNKLIKEAEFNCKDMQIILSSMGYYFFEVNMPYTDLKDCGNVDLCLIVKTGDKQLKSSLLISSQDKKNLEDYFIKGHQYENQQIKWRIEQDKVNLLVLPMQREQVQKSFYITNLKFTKEGIYMTGNLVNQEYDFSDSGCYISYLRMKELHTNQEICIESNILEEKSLLNNNMERATYSRIEHLLRFKDLNQGKYSISIQTNDVRGIHYYNRIENCALVKEKPILYYDKNRKITLDILDNQELIFEMKSNFINWLWYIKQTISSRLKGNKKFIKTINQIKVRWEIVLGQLINKKIKERLKNKLKKWMSRIATKEDLYELSYKVFKRLPINRNKIIFTSYKDTISANYTSILEEIYNQNLDKKIIHLLGNRNFNIYELIKRSYHLATAEIVVLEDYHRFLYKLEHRKETRFIQIWHAAGAFKKFGFSSLGKKDSINIDFEKRAHRFYTDVIASSEFIVPFYAEAFNVEQKRIKAIGVPRTDMFFDMNKKEEIIKKIYYRYPILKGKKVILYAPTFRGNTRERVNFYNPIELEKLKFLNSENIVLLYKVHPVCSKSCIIPEEYKNFVINMSEYENVNELFFIADFLITDYSSVVFEYAIFNKPIVFYAYDLENYLGERDFYYDYDEFVPGPIVKNTDELIESIKSYNGNWYQDNTKFVNKFFDNNLDGNTAKRFVDLYIKGKKDE